MALAIPVSASATSFDVTATLSQNGKQIDSVTVPYRCDALGAACSNIFLSTKAWYVYLAIGIVVLILLGLWARSRRRKNLQPVPPQLPPQ
jgi:LPXTG-motif cell wall-anchored protein